MRHPRKKTACPHRAHLSTPSLALAFTFWFKVFSKQCQVTSILLSFYHLMPSRADLSFIKRGIFLIVAVCLWGCSLLFVLQNFLVNLQEVNKDQIVLSRAGVSVDERLYVKKWPFHGFWTLAFHVQLLQLQVVVSPHPEVVRRLRTRGLKVLGEIQFFSTISNVFCKKLENRSSLWTIVDH